uniref:Uncharacterized protein n=1 Tax=Anguilla anguilla TaxID=7936 RepID=A0A0E9QD68_ANGAN
MQCLYLFKKKKFYILYTVQRVPVLFVLANRVLP